MLNTVSNAKLEIYGGYMTWVGYVMGEVATVDQYEGGQTRAVA